MHKTVISQPDDLTVLITRTFDAPRDLVWVCWTQAEHIAKWFGPKLMTIPVCTSDLRPGGEWRIVMRDPAGIDYPCKGVYQEVKAPVRFTSTVNLSEHPDSWYDTLDPGRDKSKPKSSYDNIWQISFAERDGQTTVTIKTLFKSSDMRDKFMKLGMSEGWSQSFEKLDAVLKAAA